MMMTLTRQSVMAQVPIVEDVTSAVVGDVAGWGFDRVADGVATWVLGAVGFFVEGSVDFLLNSASPDITAAWFSGPGSPFSLVRNMAGVMLLGFVFLGLIQGLLAGDVGGMVRRVALDLPGAVIGTAAVIVVTDQLLALTDALSAAVLAGADGQAIHFLSGFGATVNDLTHGFAAVLLGLVAILAGFLVWVELTIRSVLVYTLVALSPLAFATTVWPAARGVLRRTIEVLLAVVFSKLVIAIAISVGVAALSGAGTAAPAGASGTDELAAGMGTLFAGTAILVMAAFSPFLLLKLMPVAEAALVAQGVSRSPARGAQVTMSNVYHAQSLARLAGGNKRQQRSNSSSNGPGPGAGGGGRWAVGPGTTAGSPAIGGGSSAATAGAGGASAAAGPAGAVVAGGAAVAKTAGRAAGEAASTASEAAAQPTTPPPQSQPRRPSKPPPRPRGGDPS